MRRAARLSYDGVSPNPLALNPLKSAGAGRAVARHARAQPRALPANSAPRPAVTANGGSEKRPVVRPVGPSLCLDSNARSRQTHRCSNSYHHAREARGAGRAGADRDVYMLPQEPTFQPVMLTAAQVATVPEDAELSFFGDDGGDDALQAFMARNAASIKLNVRDVAKPSDFGSHRMRFWY